VRYRLLLLVFTLAVAAAGCGVPSSIAKQAEDLASIAAEGSLLAGDVAEGRSTSPFTATHAQALRKKAETLSPAITQPDLRRVANEVVADLARLSSAPEDRAAVAGIERRLDEAAKRAEEIGKAAP
jgi:hypothetical protein